MYIYLYKQVLFVYLNIIWYEGLEIDDKIVENDVRVFKKVVVRKYKFDDQILIQIFID